MADVIHGPPADSGLSIASMRIVEHYRLGDQYRYMPGDAATWFGSFTEALPDRRWVVIPMADPRWLARAHPIRVLNEPAGLLGAPNRAVLLASQRFVARAPEATLAALRRIKLDIADVSDMDYRVHVLNLTAKAAAQAWMADHPELVESWFKQGAEKLR
jgi:glycine betaine/proline transport system substrate-binding protein